MISCVFAVRIYLNQSLLTHSCQCIDSPAPHLPRSPHIWVWPEEQRALSWGPPHPEFVGQVRLAAVECRDPLSENCTSYNYTTAYLKSDRGKT